MEAKDDAPAGSFDAITLLWSNISQHLDVATQLWEEAAAREAHFDLDENRARFIEDLAYLFAMRSLPPSHQPIAYRYLCTMNSSEKACRHQLLKIVTQIRAVAEYIQKILHDAELGDRLMSLGKDLLELLHSVTPKVAFAVGETTKVLSAKAINQFGSVMENAHSPKNPPACNS